jgi:murein DD-endopeptidase MepM/ murein hydrolase activator NlpD
VFAHLAAGLKVHKGDRVHAGDVLGRIGFSGNLDFVHTHVQLYAANGADADPAILTSDGVPMYFRDFIRVRGVRAERVTLDGLAAGDVVRVAR